MWRRWRGQDLEPGNRVATFSLATSRQWKNTQGEKQEKTEWHRCVAWNAKTYTLADIVEAYAKKGDKVYVEGSIEYRQWQDRRIRRATRPRSTSAS
jgi:single-strand DNA-binding protein